MSDFVPSKKTEVVAEKIMKIFEEEDMTFAEIADVPAELERRINKSISNLKKETHFKLLL